MRYIRENVYESHPAALPIIVDNVDREPSIVQNEVKLILKPFARVSGGRTILTARQSTFYQQLLEDDGLSDPVDVVAYCGSDPIDIVTSRIDEFTTNPQKYADFYNPRLLPNLVKGIEYIRRNHLSSENFVALFSGLCGRSIRRGLMLAQHIVDNSVYDPSTIYPVHSGRNESAYLGIGSVRRALLVGTDDIFRTTPGNQIDNIFQVDQHLGQSYWVKTRILSLLHAAGSKGVRIGVLLDVCSGFGYPLSLVLDAINELKTHEKRLVWSDEVRASFRDEDDLTRHLRSGLYISTAGEGYCRYLLADIDYIHEVMLDTFVEDGPFGGPWKYDQIEDRFELLLKYLTYLSNYDRQEVQNFVVDRGGEDYVQKFKSRTLVSTRMFEDVRASVNRILSSIVDNSHHDQLRYERFRDLRARQIGIYEDRLIMFRNFEDSVFG